MNTLSTMLLMLDTLLCIPLFHDLEVEQVMMLKPLFEKVNYPPETAIITQGATAVYLHLIIKGGVAIYYKPYDGPALILTRLHEGDVFGWSAVVGSHFYTSSIISEIYTETIRIKGSDLLTLIKEHPKTGRDILNRLARSVSPRWENAHEQVELLLNSES